MTEGIITNCGRYLGDDGRIFIGRYIVILCEGNKFCWRSWIYFTVRIFYFKWFQFILNEYSLFSARNCFFLVYWIIIAILFGVLCLWKYVHFVSRFYKFLGGQSNYFSVFYKIPLRNSTKIHFKTVHFYFPLPKYSTAQTIICCMFVMQIGKIKNRKIYSRFHFWFSEKLYNWIIFTNDIKYTWR